MECACSRPGNFNTSPRGILFEVPERDQTSSFLKNLSGLCSPHLQGVPT